MKKRPSHLTSSARRNGIRTCLRSVAPTVGLVLSGALAALATTDYAPAIDRMITGCTKWYTSGSGHKFCVVHDMEGYYYTGTSYLRRCDITVSCHYTVNGLTDSSDNGAPPGQMAQLVRESYYAWHAVCWNKYSYGVEHEGFVSNPAWFTEDMYQASALLFRHFCDKSGIAKDRNHIVGHDAKKSAAWCTWAEANLGIDAHCNSHTDPGSYWNWSHYMALIVGNTNNASVASSSVPSAVIAGRPFTATLTLKNTGTTSWTNTGANAYKLGSQTPADNTTWGLSRVALPSSPIAAGATAAFTINATAPTNLGTYTFAWKMLQEGLASFGSTYSGSISVVSASPTITTQPASQAVTVGSTVKFAVGVAGDPTLVYQWSENGTNLSDGGNISGTTTATLTIANVQDADEGSYAVVVTNSLGSATSTDAVLTVSPAPRVATWGPNTTSEGQVVLNSMNVSSDNHQSFTMNVGRHSTTTDYNEARPTYHWYGTGTKTPLNRNIVTTGGTFTHTCSAVYSSTASASVRIYMLATPFPIGSNDKTTVLISWPYYDYAHSLSWTNAGGDILGSYLTNVTMVNTGSYTWTWTATRNAGCGVQLRNATSTSDYNYRKTFTQYGKPSLTLSYIPPSGEANSCVQNWNVIGPWGDADATLGTDFLAQISTDPRGVSEAELAASTAATYNDQSFAVTAQNDDLFDAGAYGWGATCSGYGFVYVYYNHATNAAVYLGVGSDDRFKLWLNGSMVASWLTASGRSWTPDGSFVGPVTLRQGWNRVLIKVQNGASTYRWSLRFANADRSALGNCTFAVSDNTAPNNPTHCVDLSGSTDNVPQGTNPAPNFTWSGAADPATSGEGISGVKGYYVYWGGDADGTDVSALTITPAYAPPPVPEEGTYYLRVAAYDYALNTADWQTLYTFTYGLPTISCSQTNAPVSITQNTNGTLDLAFQGTPDAQYFVVANTNAADAMGHWVIVPGSTNTVTNTSGLWSVTVTNDSNQRFYRSVATSLCP
jgi:hypothetical protein